MANFSFGRPNCPEKEDQKFSKVLKTAISTRESTRVYEFGAFRLDPVARTLFRGTERIPLTHRCFEALLMLVESNGNPVSKDDLMNALWPNRFVEEGNLTQSIFTIRRALGETAHEQKYIFTVPGFGYRFTSDVREVGAPAAADNDAYAVLDAPCLAPQSPSSPATRLRRVVGAASACILLAAVTMFLVRKAEIRPESPSAITSPHSGAPQRRSIAVLGFEDLSPGSGHQWLSTALGEMISTEIGSGQRLRLITAEDVSRAHHEIAWSDAGSLAIGTLARIRRDLTCDLVVLGSYTMAGDAASPRLRIDVRVQDASTGEFVTEIGETGNAVELFGLVSRTGARLRNALGLPEMSSGELLSAEAARPSTTAAARLYSEGLDKLRVFDALGARDSLEPALGLDPSYSLAHAALAEAWAQQGYDQRAISEAGKAFDLSGRLPPAEQLEIEGQFRTANHDWVRAEAIYRSLRDMFPDNPEYVLRLAATQTSAAHPQDALRTLDAMRSFNGNDPRVELERAKAWTKLGDFGHMSAALALAADKARANGASLLLARARYQQCWVSRFLDQPQQGIEHCREAQRVYAAAGDRQGEADTLRVLGDVIAGSDPSGAMLLYQQALAVQREIGHLTGEADVLNEIAVQYSAQGKHAQAKEVFQQVLRIFEKTDNRVDASGMLINIGSELASQDELDKARNTFQQAVKAARELSNKDMEALARSNLGLIQREGGNLDDAKRSLESAQSLFREAGDQANSSDCIFGLGEIAAVEGDFRSARSLHQQALAIRKASHREIAVAQSELALAKLSLHENQVGPDVENSVRRAADTFRKAHSPEDEANAEAVLASILLSQNNPADARKEAERMLEVCAICPQGVRLSLDSQVALVFAATTSMRQLPELKRRWAAEISRAHTLGYAEPELRLRISLAELKIRSGEKAQGDSELAYLRTEAKKMGFAVID